MKNVTAWLNLIRPINLFIIALTQYFINIFLFIPNFSTYGIFFSLDAFHFFLLVLSTVFICAGGYVINDYYDVQADAINKPAKQIVEKSISKQTALTGYWILTGAGLLLGSYVAYMAGNLKLAALHCICILLLYFYSYSYKKILLLGNIIVALLSVLSILIVGVFEPNIYNLQREGDYYIAGLIWKYLLGISLFAFLLTLVREIIKDAEDMDGDNTVYVNSVPLAWGIQAAKGIVCALLAVIIALVTYAAFFGLLQESMLYLIYIFVLLIVLLFSFYYVVKAHEKKNFTFISKLVKLIMLLGIIFLPVYYFVNF